MRNPKCFINNTVVELCSSIQEGLPLVAAPYIELLIEGILARALWSYPVTLCHVVFLANHLHMIVVVRDPEDVSKFMGYLKTELGHAVNRLLGRSQRNVWIPRFDSPTILTPSDVIARLTYLYSNPLEAGLVDSIEQYPGVNSFRALLNKGERRLCKKVHRNAIPTLPNTPMTFSLQRSLSQQLAKAKGTDYELKIEPFAWLECFEESKNWNPDDVLTTIRHNIEAEALAIKKRRNRPAIGRTALINQDPRKAYTSTGRNGQKMICICSDIELRKAFIAWFKEQAHLARAAFQARKAGIHNSLPPPGFFLPGGLLLANVLLPTAIF